MTTTDVPVRVVETPAEALRRLAIAPDVPKEELRAVIADAVNDVVERLDAAQARRRDAGST